MATPDLRFVGGVSTGVAGDRTVASFAVVFKSDNLEHSFNAIIPFIPDTACESGLRTQACDVQH